MIRSAICSALVCGLLSAAMASVSEIAISRSVFTFVRISPKITIAVLLSIFSMIPTVLAPRIFTLSPFCKGLFLSASVFLFTALRNFSAAFCSLSALFFLFCLCLSLRLLICSIFLAIASSLALASMSFTSFSNSFNCCLMRFVSSFSASFSRISRMAFSMRLLLSFRIC